MFVQKKIKNKKFVVCNCNTLDNSKVAVRITIYNLLPQDLNFENISFNN